MINLSTWIFPFGDNDQESKELLSKLVIKDNAFVTNNTIKQDFEAYYRRYLPADLDGFMYGVSGTQAIEYAMRIACKITGKKKFVYFRGSYHGNSLSMLPMAFHDDDETHNIRFKEVEPPYCYRCKSKCEGDYLCLQRIFYDIDMNGNDIAGIIVDPSFGNIVCNPGKEYFKMLKNGCTQRNIQLIFDEIRVAYGRTGRIFAFEFLDTVPDILCVSKAIACGLPLSLAIYNSKKITYGEIVDHNYYMESTFAGQSICLEMAKYTISKLDKLVSHGQHEDRINYFREKLNTLLKYDCIGDIRNFGLIYAIEFVHPTNGEYSELRAQKFISRIRKQGIYTNGTRYKSILLIHPFINISYAEIDEVIDIFHKCLK